MSLNEWIWESESEIEEQRKRGSQEPGEREGNECLRRRGAAQSASESALSPAAQTRASEFSLLC